MNFWPGSMQNAFTASSDTDVDNASFYVYRTRNAPIVGTDASGIKFASYASTDPRILRRASGNLLPNNGLLSTALPAPANSPYLLLPKDEIIFGIESDVLCHTNERSHYKREKIKNLNLVNAF